MRAALLDGAGLHESGDPEMLAVGGVAHGPKLFDGHIVTFTLLHAGIGEIAKRANDDRDSHAELDVFTFGLRHN